tara:strand:+ start:69 stop:521 length:453 start_codon:yes stop_codon:yes gene_type:complete
MESPKQIAKKGTQETLPIKGIHESYDTYNEEANRFMDMLQEKNVTYFYWGFAWENDESHCRHVSYDLVGDTQTGYDQGARHDSEEILRGTEWERKEWSCVLYDSFPNEADDDNMYCIDVTRRKLAPRHPLYITEPKLVDQHGDEVTWNAY